MDKKDTDYLTKPYETLKILKAVTDVADILYQDGLQFKHYPIVFQILDKYYKSVIEREDHELFPESIIEPASPMLRDEMGL